MRIYVAHTYGRQHGLTEAECEANTFKAIEVGRALIKKGHNPFIPNLFHFVHKGWSETLPEEQYFSLVSQWLWFCHALLIAEMPPWEDSGVEREVRIAKGMGLIIYNSLEEVPDEWADQKG